MKDTETGWQEGKTLLTTAAGQESSVTPEAVPALTILAHSDPSRVGERLLLPALAAGLEVRLSRLEPVFRHPGLSELPARALEERHLSRQPFRLSGGDPPGSVTFHRDAVRTPLLAGGQAVAERRVFSATEVDRGVVLLLGHRVVLLLHRLPMPAPAEPVSEEPGTLGLVGESSAMAQLRLQIRRLSALEVPVLLCGATGTGKELTARALHEAGGRRLGPYVVVNMATLPPSLAAAELFGAVRGAYTGADRKKTGLFQQAKGGTLFLDEIGETPSEVQPMLLRALENHEIRPVGGSETVAVDVRVVAATDANLEQAIAAGTFRAPLYHRLAGYALRLPPLKERRDDIGRLLIHFLEEEMDQLEETTWQGGEADHPWPPASLLARLAQYDWPGNVRELRNVVRRLVILGRDTSPDVLAAQVEELLSITPPSATPPVVEASSAPPSAAQSPSADATTSVKIPKRRRLRKVSEVSEDELLAALEKHRFKVQQTADALGLSRINLYRLIESCPAVRKAADLERQEIEDALAHCGGDREEAAASLRVSLQGLKRQMTALGLGRG